MGASSKYLVIYHAISAGQNGPNLGCDEEEIVMILYLVLNVAENKVVGLHQYPVKPSGADINENFLSEEAMQEFGIKEQLVRTAPPLASVIGQFDRVACDELGSNLTLVTDGQLHLRQSLYPEAIRKNITLPSYYQRFHDLRKEFAAAVPGHQPPPACKVDSEEDQGVEGEEEEGGVDSMLRSLSLQPDASPDLAVRRVNSMARILQRLLSDGGGLHEAEQVMLNLEPGIRSRGEQVDNHAVVRARGLPWQASDTDIARFFTGLNVSPGGVALCLSAQGRRNGEALVLFESAPHRDMALRRHKHHIGNRYIEVYKATGEDFISVAGGNNTEAQEFLGRGGQVIIRMRGLPYDCTAKQVIDFFNTGGDPCDVLDEDHGVLFVKKPDGRATGDAFVLFKEEGDGEKALQKHKEVIGSRYIELFRSTTAEVQQVLNRSTEPASQSSKSGGGSGGGGGGGGGALQAPLLPCIPPVPPMAVIPQQLITAGTRKDCIRLRGLPYEAQVEHILEFLGDHAKNIVYQGVHMVFNAQGQPSGEAFIQMDGEGSAFGAANHRHHRYMVFGKKQRYIEVFQCSGEDMSLVLTGGAAATGGQTKPPLLSPGMSDQMPTQAQAVYQPADPLIQCAPQQLPTLLNLPPPVQLLPGLVPQQPLGFPPPNIQQQQQQQQLLMLLQQQQLQGIQQQQMVGLQQQGLLGLQPPQQLLLYPRLQNPPMSLAQNVAQPRFLLPNPQLTSFPQVNGMKRSHDQAFMAGTSGAGVPPKRPPVMYGTPPLEATGTPPPPALLPTPPSLPSYPV